jgi:hypothetical protein
MVAIAVISISLKSKRAGGEIYHMLKIVLLLAAIGHILCGVCDCLLGYSPSGRWECDTEYFVEHERVSG